MEPVLIWPALVATAMSAIVLVLCLTGTVRDDGVVAVDLAELDGVEVSR